MCTGAAQKIGQTNYIADISTCSSHLAVQRAEPVKNLVILVPTHLNTQSLSQQIFQNNKVHASPLIFPEKIKEDEKEIEKKGNQRLQARNYK
jgi:hypothetical protein